MPNRTKNCGLLLFSLPRHLSSLDYSCFLGALEFLAMNLDDSLPNIKLVS